MQLVAQIDRLILSKRLVLLRSEINTLSKTIANKEDLLSAFVSTIEALKFTGFDVRAVNIPGKRAELRLEAQNEKAVLVVQPLLNPSRKILDASGTVQDRDFIIVSPHIPSDLAEDYKKAAINHGDLNGRLFIQTPWFLLDREPKAALHRNPVAEPDLFSPRASRIVRALLSHRDRAWTQEAFVERTKVSRGLLSRILATLTRRGYVKQESAGTRLASAVYRLADFDRLLDAWKAADTWTKRVSVQRYTVLTNEAGEIARMVRDALGEDKVFFTQWFAAYARHPYTTPPIVSAYITEGRKLPELKFVRQEQTGGNLWLISPEDEGVFLETQEREGFRLVSDVQIYLDLVQMGQRGPDAAEALRAWDGFGR